MKRRTSPKKNPTPKLNVSVTNHQMEPQPGVRVQLRKQNSKQWKPLTYDTNTQVHTADKLSEGDYRLKIQGPRGWTREERSITIKPGMTGLNVTLAPEGTPYYLAADGEKVYFTPDEGKMLLAVHGQFVHRKLPVLLKNTSIKLGKALVPKGQRPGTRQALHILNLPRSEGARREARAALKTVVEEQFPQEGLTGQLAVPVFRGEECTEGFTNEVIVRFKSSVSKQQVDGMARKLGATVLREITYLGNAYLWRYAEVPSYKVLDLIRELTKSHHVEYAEPNILYQTEKDVYNPNDYLYPGQPHLQLVNADDAWDTLDDIAVNLRAGSPDITVAVFDSDGVDPTHPDLTGNLTDGTAKMVANFDFENWQNQTVPNLDGDHGTQCASSAVGRFDNAVGCVGIAGNCHLIGAQCPSIRSGIDMADAWIWAAGFPTGSTNPNFPAQLARGADVISNSWGNTWAALSNLIRDTLDFLTVYGRNGKGCIMCFSVGNLGYVQFSNRRTWAAYERTLAIGASINTNPTNPCNSAQADHNGNLNNLPAVVDTRTYYNPFGPEMDIVAPSHTCYDPALAGAQILDPILSASATNNGDWPGSATAATTLTGAAAAGQVNIGVANSAGFAVGEFALFGGPAATPRETQRITGVAAGQITVTPLDNAYAAGTTVVTGPNDYAQNENVGFGGTSHSCPTVAGAAALVLSVRPELTWVQVREILRTSAAQIDAAQANATGQWVDLDGDGVDDFSQWYGYGRLDVNAAVIAARDLGAMPDIVVRDNLTDNGTVPSGGWHAHSPDIWVRRTDDPIPALAYDASPPHQNPWRNQDNYVYMRVKNFGGAPSLESYLRVLIVHYPGFEFRYPEEWMPSTRPGDPVPNPLTPGSYLIGEERIDNLAAGASQIVKMTWNAALVPPDTVMVAGVNVSWHPCLLAEVSPHDGPAPAAGTLDVKADNNLAHRNITVDDPSDTGGDVAVGVVAGTGDPSGVESVIIDRSMLPADYKVFVRIADERHMEHWASLVKAARINSTHVLAESPASKEPEEQEEPDRPTHAAGHKKPCAVTLLDRTSLRIDCCDGNHMIIDAQPKTRIVFMCGGHAGSSLGTPSVRMDQVQGKQAVFFDGGSQAIELPLRLAGGQYVPLAIGFLRPCGKKAVGLLKATQRRGDGTLSPGYSIEG